jgi:hypothetical protein
MDRRLHARLPLCSTVGSLLQSAVHRFSSADEMLQCAPTVTHTHSLTHSLTHALTHFNATPPCALVFKLTLTAPRRLRVPQGELSFNEGDLIYVSNKGDDGWWLVLPLCPSFVVRVGGWVGR